MIEAQLPQLPILIRAARAADLPAIYALILKNWLNPLGVDWRRFLVAEERGTIVAIGQVKPHDDGSRELASIAVVPQRRSRGLARLLIRRLLAREQEPLYLMCRSRLSSYYLQFGFVPVYGPELPPTFQQVVQLATVVARLLPFVDTGVAIMYRSFSAE